MTLSVESVSSPSHHARETFDDSAPLLLLIRQKAKAYDPTALLLLMRRLPNLSGDGRGEDLCLGTRVDTGASPRTPTSALGNAGSGEEEVYGVR